MKIRSLLLIILLITAGCSKPKGQEQLSGKLSVVTTVFPPYDFARQVAGDNIELTMLLHPGMEPHSFDPTPQDIIKIQNSDLFIYVGGSSDIWMDKIIDSIDSDEMRILSLIELVDAVEEEMVEGMEEDDHEEEVDLDEHVWTAPSNAIKIVKAIAETLYEIDPENTELYRSNSEAYIEQLNDLDREIRGITDNSERNVMVFGDRFPMRYFADEYNLKYFAAFPGCASETEASASTITFLIDKINNENLPVVFYTEFSNMKMADIICESTGAKKLMLHSCHNITGTDFENGVTYLDLMKQNSRNLKEALN